MIKKLVILVVLAAAGYVGYLVWNNLNPSEQAEVKQKTQIAVEKGKELAKKAADSITGTIRSDDKPAPANDEKKTAPKTGKDLAPPSGQPGSIRFPGRQ